MSHHRRPRSAAAVLVAVFAALAVAVAPASAVPRPVVTVTNDANHDGTFSGTEVVPKHATYPYSVPEQVVVTTTGQTKLNTLTSSLFGSVCGSSLPTTILSPATFSCSFTGSLAAASSAPLTDTVTLVYGSGGQDVVSGSSTIFIDGKCNSGNGNGSDPFQNVDPTAHCYGGDPGNSYNAHNKGGDETDSPGSDPNPGGNNSP